MNRGAGSKSGPALEATVDEEQHLTLQEWDDLVRLVEQNRLGIEESRHERLLAEQAKHRSAGRTLLTAEHYSKYKPNQARRGNKRWRPL